MEQYQSTTEKDNYRKEGGGNHQSSRLRNADKHYSNDANSDGGDEDGSMHNKLPDYSRIVIVGGGMAGLHTALALAERMSDPSVQDANPPPPAAAKKILKSSSGKQRQTTTNRRIAKEEIIVLDASQIGNGASGRAKGLVVPGFQVPLENLQEMALDYTNSSGDGGRGKSS